MTTAIVRPHILSDRRVVAMLGLGFASGLPLYLVYATLSVWLSDARVSIVLVALLSELMLPYKLKFLWAPFLDRHDCPLLGRLLGRRRGWLVAAQLLVLVSLCGIALGDPGSRLSWTIVFALALAFAGSSGDVVIDGWRIAVAPEKKAVMSSWAEIGWRIGTLAGGAGALYLSDHVGWRGAYLGMAMLTAPGLAAALLAPEPAAPVAAAPVRASRPAAPSRPLWDGHDFPSHLRRLGAWVVARIGWSLRPIVEPIWTPMRDLWTRLGPMAAPILLLVAGFRMPGYVAAVMANPLYKALHYSNSDIATVTKVFGFWLALAATFLGGWLVTRIGMMATLFLGTAAGSASHLSLAWLAAHGGQGEGAFWVFAVAVSIENFAYAFASIVLITYMSTLCGSVYAASQYALLTSLVALPGSLIALNAGFVIERLGFERFFIGTSLIGLPVAALCLWVWLRQPPPPPASAKSADLSAH